MNDHECDVCKVEFPHATPGRAEWDAPTAGGPWGYLCEGHEGYMTSLRMATPLTERAKRMKKMGGVK